MDVSDGLLTDLKKLCAASGVGAQLNVDLLPESAAMRELFEADDGLQYALAGGDDYELLFTTAADKAATILALGEEIGLPLSRIGRCTAGAGLGLTDRGTPVPLPARLGFEHG